MADPNILTLIDSGSADGFMYYVPPYVEGESLRDRLRVGVRRYGPSAQVGGRPLRPPCLSGNLRRRRSL